MLAGWFSERDSVSRFFWSAASASFSRTSWRAAILAPFFAAPKVKLGCDSFQLQEMHHGKEVVLWQSEL